jgi:hypothetical protein
VAWRRGPWDAVGSEERGRLKRPASLANLRLDEAHDPSSFPGPIHGCAPKEPRVRLCKMRPAHVRLIELMRVMLTSPMQAIMVGDHSVVFEMARRGVLDPVEHFSWKSGRPTPTKVALNIVERAARQAVALGLVDEAGQLRFRLCRDGLETLVDWDDTRADGVYPERPRRRRPRAAKPVKSEPTPPE